MNCTATQLSRKSRPPGSTQAGRLPGSSGRGPGNGGGNGRREQKEEEEEEGQPSPLSREDCRGYSAFQYILHSQAPETDRCASRFALTPPKESLGHSGLGSPRGAWERANPPESLFRTLTQTLTGAIR